MTKLRAHFPLLVCATALALSAAATPAAAQSAYLHNYDDELPTMHMNTPNGAHPAPNLSAEPKGPPAVGSIERRLKVNGQEIRGAPKLSGVPKAPQPALNAYISKVQGEKQ